MKCNGSPWAYGHTQCLVKLLSTDCTAAEDRVSPLIADTDEHAMRQSTTMQPVIVGKSQSCTLAQQSKLHQAYAHVQQAIMQPIVPLWNIIYRWECII